MSTTAHDRLRENARGDDRGAADAAPVLDRDRVDLGTVRVIHTRHWFRWTLSAIIAFAVAQFVWSLITNPNYEW
jgi:polar amino acid transport system permease protein